ncbi:D-2-hydroxyacid dehydrogenase family protein [Trinickia acidisoli]|uniref:D-2-hydroxyacid dehydrogenase family protein n=1 Tax=Trinickia acidisoli TaxID=2767482 RepID=UPI001A8C445A|nr:D-2-hydroxyacid dehydrogenase family protein [Trinickia acidisoli]
MNILIPDDYQRAVAQLQCAELLSDHTLTILGDLHRQDDLHAILAHTECLVLIRERTRVDAGLLAKMPALRLISQTGPIGRHIDMTACDAAGIAVTQGSGSPHAPAEFTWLLIMNACRRFYEAVDAFRQGQWQVNCGSELHGKTLGILGFGKLGKMVARYAQAFGMKVQIWGSERARAEAVAVGYSASTSRAEFFSSADVITVHLRLADETRDSISLADLSLMKPSAVFVNTSRAELIAPGALETALRQGRPGYAAIDVFESEPIYNRTHPLFALPNVLCTPHLGYVAEQSYEAYFHSAFSNVLRFIAGDYGDVLNPAVLKKR